MTESELPPGLPPELPEGEVLGSVEVRTELSGIRPRLRRMRRKLHWSLRLGSISGNFLLILLGLLGILFFWMSSAGFESLVRRRAIAALENATGGRVEISAFHWDLLHLRFEADGITIHGLEAATEAPYAHVGRLRVQFAVLGLFASGVSPRILLREAEIVQPEFHLIVYPDGTTNQPHPRTPQPMRKPAMDTLFDAEIGRLAVENGSVHIADRDANRTLPLDLRAEDTRLLLSWVPDGGFVPGLKSTLAPRSFGSYRIQLGVGDLAFAQGKFTPPPSRLDANVLLLRDGVQVDSLRLRSMDHTLFVHGRMTGFQKPVWQAQAQGQVDLRVLEPFIGFSLIREGLVDLKASAAGQGLGQGSSFKMAGDLTSTAIHYQDTVVDAHTGDFSAHFRADEKQLLVSEVKIGLAQGGELNGEFQYDNWLDSTPKVAAQRELRRLHQSWPVPTGVVRAELHGVTLDTILDILAKPGYRRLGLDAVVNGPASAAFSGLGEDLEIGGQLSLHGSASAVAGEVPAVGSIDATFHAETGSVAVRSVDVTLPHSSLRGQGTLGVEPVTRASAMQVDLVSSRVAELDQALRVLGLKQGNRTGAAALPFLLAGQAEFQGQLNSSFVTPRVDGHWTASNIDLQVSSTVAGGNAAPQYLHWDSLDVDALYSPATIVVRRGVLKRGASSVTLQGHIDSVDPYYKLSDKEDDFGPGSALSVKATAQQFPLSDLWPLAKVSVPVDGKLTAQVDVEGTLQALSGSGTVDLDKTTAYGETIDHLHAVGTVGGVNGQRVNISSLTVQQSAGVNGGRVTGTGSYDLAKGIFAVDARGAGIDLGSIQRLRQAGVAVNGKLGFTANGGGTLDDPNLQAKATLSGMTVGGGAVADLLVSAVSRDRAVTYDLSSKQLGGQFSAHGTTRFDADATTQARMDFSKFDIGAVFKLMRVTGIAGQSDLEGTASVSGPLAHPEKLNGEASLKQLAVAVQGVHLGSKGPVHATLAAGVAHLDPLEITGENTDLKVRGTLAVAGKQQLDLEANGSVNLRLAESLDPDLIASGVTNFQMEAHGPLTAPILQGKVEFQNAALALQDFPNGLSQIQGTLEFIQNRLEVRSLTAQSGGGQLRVGGYLGFQHGLYADLTATGKSIRIRYPQGISSLADASLKLQGPQNNLLLSGNVQVTRFAINSDLDITSFASNAGGVPAIVAPDAPSNHIRFDVHLTSAPQLNFQNAYAKLAGDADLHLRGTLASPSLLGRITMTEGSTSIGGTKYELERGDIYFNNPVRIQPNIDLDATARVEDYDITLGLHGTPEKLNVSYRSEPPLPEADVIALLALGRTQDEEATYGAQQPQSGGDNPTTDALLGGALNATVSNRVQRLFGTGAVKVDPNFIGSLGNSTARVTVVEQIGKNLTFTYASNVNTTTQQLIQAEVAINRHVSLLVTQDESGIFSVVVKTRRRYK